MSDLNAIDYYVDLGRKCMAVYNQAYDQMISRLSGIPDLPISSTHYMAVPTLYNNLQKTNGNLLSGASADYSEKLGGKFYKDLFYRCNDLIEVINSDNPNAPNKGGGTLSTLDKKDYDYLNDFSSKMNTLWDGVQWDFGTASTGSWGVQTPHQVCDGFLDNNMATGGFADMSKQWILEVAYRSLAATSIINNAIAHLKSAA